MGLQDRDYYRDHHREQRAAMEKKKVVFAEEKPWHKQYPAWLLWLAATGAIYTVTLAIRFLKWVIS